MFGIGFWELILLSLIGLVILGPERLPRVANQLGSWLGQARRMTRVMKRQLEDELNIEKEFSINPPNREPSTQPPPYVPNEDDTYSPLHDTPGADDYSQVDDEAIASSDLESATAAELASKNEPVPGETPASADSAVEEESDPAEAGAKKAT